MTGPKPALSALPHWPRLLSEEQAAAYVGVSASNFRSRIGNPWPAAIRIGRRLLYDRLALDSAVDGLSNPTVDTPREITL